MADYIRHRLRVAGREEPLFEDAAIVPSRPRRAGRRARSTSCTLPCWVAVFSQGIETIGLAVVEEVLRGKARFGMMGRQELPRGAAGQSAAGCVAALAGEHASRRRDDDASGAVLTALFERKK